jgi:hypothetical protein
LINIVNLLLSLAVVVRTQCLLRYIHFAAKQTVTWQLNADTQSRCVQNPCSRFYTLDPNFYPAIIVCRHTHHFQRSTFCKIKLDDIGLLSCYFFGAEILAWADNRETRVRFPAEANNLLCSTGVKAGSDLPQIS